PAAAAAPAPRWPTPQARPAAQRSRRSAQRGADPSEADPRRLPAPYLPSVRCTAAPPPRLDALFGLARHSPHLFEASPKPSPHQRQRADGGRKRDLLRRHRIDFDRDRLRDQRLVVALVRALIDGEDLDVLQHHVVGADPLVDLARERNVDAIARQYETADTFDI